MVERPGEKILFIEIKSSTNVYREQLTTFSKLAKDFKHCEAICFSRDIRSKQFDNITIYPWQEGIITFFVPENIKNDRFLDF